MQKGIKIISLLIFLLFLSFKPCASITHAEVPLADTSEKAQKKAANKIANRASLYSAILPGMGQAYNKKYWKIPIIYAGLGAFGYLIATNNHNYELYHKELVYRYSHNLQPSNPNSSLGRYSVEDINTLKMDAKKYLDFCIIGMGIVYLLNIIDANVDGHFRSFNISDDLSLKIKPKASYCIQNPQRPLNLGVSFCLTFK